MSESEEFGYGLNIITITTRDKESVPEVDLGSVSPMEAFGILNAAIQTVNLLIPHCDISTNGKQILSIMDLDAEDETPD